MQTPEPGLKGHEDLLARFGLKAAAEYYADPVNTPVQLNLAILPRFMLCDNPGDFSNFGPASRLGDAFVRNQYPYAHFTDFPAATLQALFTFKDTKPLGLLAPQVSTGTALGKHPVDASAAQVPTQGDAKRPRTGDSSHRIVSASSTPMVFSIARTPKQP